jgi:hypothetical protein
MKRFLLLIFILSLASCKHNVENVQRALYYWKSNEYYFTNKEIQVCNNLETQKLYVKFFEVDYHSAMGGYPISKTSLGSSQIDELQIISVVPTVYLRNAVFLNSTKEDLDILADNIDFLINKFRSKFRGKIIDEFQMDCDWTPRTRDNYFYFLNRLKVISCKQISATLRLYPYKYPEKMGIPPVDKVMLMCYNLLNPLENPSKNSILDLKELKSYLQNAREYPIHLDFAIPTYSWAQVYHNESFSDVLYTDAKQLKSILKQEKSLWYEVIRDTVVNNTFLRVGDKIKYEEIDAAKLKTAITLLNQYFNIDKNTTVALFHLDEIQINNFTNEELSDFYTDFSK